MRVLAIRGRNLASIAGDFAIDFEAEPLAGSGIFAITGPTGAGKSTLLDALSLALFNDIPRLRAAPDRSQVGEGDTLSAKDSRAILRHGTGDGFAEVDFAMPGGARYRARWSVKRARGKAEGRIQNHEHAFERLDTSERLGGTRTETLAAIRDVIGLSAEQFGRAVLLAQGDFEAFIRANADERALLLERLTGSAIYARLGQRAWEKANRFKAALEMIERDIAAQHGLDDAARTAAEAQRDAAVAEEQAAAEALAALTLARHWEQRSAELITQAGQADRDEVLAREAVTAAEPRRAALARSRIAFGFVGEWQALAEAAGLRDDTAAALQDDEAALTDARALEAKATDIEGEAQAARIDVEARGAELAPQIAEARALDLQLAEAARRRDALETEAQARDATLADAVRDDTAARQLHDVAEAAHDEHRAWLAAHEPWQQLAQREDELADSLRTFATADAARGVKAGERASLDARQRAALGHWDTAQAALDLAETGHADAATALAEVEASLPPETRFAELTAQRDALAGIERVLSDLGHARDTAAGAGEALAATQGRTAAIAGRQAETAAHLAALAGELPLLRARHDEARRACALADAAAEEAAQVLRQGLEEGEPCPVCGATEHRLSALDALLGEQRLANQQRAAQLDIEVTAKAREDAEATAEARALAAQAEDVARDLAAHEQALADAALRCERIAADLAARAAGAGLPAEPDVLAPALNTRREAADSELAALAQARTAATLARQAEQSARQARDAARSDHAAAQDALQALSRAVAEIDRDLADLDRERERIALALGHVLAPLGDWQALADPLATLRAAAGEWRGRAQGRDETAQALPALRSAMGTASEALTTARARADDAGQALARVRDDHADLAGTRARLLDGEAADTVTSRLADAGAAADAALEQARTVRERAAQQRAAAEARAAQTLVRRDETTADHGRRDAALAAKLAAAELALDDVARVAAAGAQALGAETDALAALDTALSERRAVRDKCRDDLAAHLAHDRPELQGEPLAEALLAATTSHKGASARLGEAEFTLRRDDEVRDRTAALRAEHQRQSAAAAVWLKLADLIGDSTGNRFRRFAQGLTLDRLLEHANARLADLKPRYTLQRGSGGDMLIQVIDNDMAGEVRGLHNLSGGERFLVSLALALGLAEMSTTNGVRIESLFIDEGFGALDPASLGQAVALLEHLHATGRRVGVISHVEELKERIPVKIEVTPTGRGTSEIAVVGG